ncbi:MAG: Rrf2 family transcriptional regulator [Thermodesulfobacteriota bacterium]
MNLSTKSRYGVRILTDIALHQSEGPVQNSDIAKRQDISLQYVVQILRLLKSDHLVTTVRGPKGGHVLAVSPSKITCGRLVRLLETHSDLVRCGPNAKVCKRSKDCQVRLVWMEATQSLFDKLDSVTIADLADRIQSASKETCPRERGRSPARTSRRLRSVIAQE